MMDDFRDYDPGYDKWLDARLDDYLEGTTTSKRERIRAERRRKRKAKQARKVQGRGKYNPKQISEKTAVAFLAAALLGGLKK